jgi:hypothetical protein
VGDWETGGGLRPNSPFTIHHSPFTIHLKPKA